MSIGKIIAIEGLIGVGKTTLCKSLYNQLSLTYQKVRLLEEQVNYDELAIYLANMKKEAFQFQMKMLGNRIDSMRDALDYKRNGYIVIMDRSIVGDRSFTSMQVDKEYISKEQHLIYESKSNFAPDPDLILYLNSSLETCLKRIGVRSIESEVTGYDLKYLQDLENSYHKSLKTVSCPIITLPWDENKAVRDNRLTPESLIKVMELLT